MEDSSSIFKNLVERPKIIEISNLDDQTTNWLNNVINEDNILVGMHLLGILKDEEDLIIIQEMETYSIKLKPLNRETPYEYIGRRNDTSSRNNKFFSFKELCDEFERLETGGIIDYHKLILVRNGNELGKLMDNYIQKGKLNVYISLVFHIHEKFKEVSSIVLDHLDSKKIMPITLYEPEITPSSYSDIIEYMKNINLSITFITTDSLDEDY